MAWSKNTKGKNTRTGTGTTTTKTQKVTVEVEIGQSSKRSGRAWWLDKGKQAGAEKPTTKKGSQAKPKNGTKTESAAKKGEKKDAAYWKAYWAKRHAENKAYEKSLREAQANPAGISKKKDEK